MHKIKLQSSDEEIFEVDIQVAKCSGTITTTLENREKKDKDAIVPLPNVDSTILRKVLVWASHHRNDPPPTEDDYSQTKLADIEPWDANFIEVDQETLFDLMLAAKYLDMMGLLILTCKATANIIKGKTPEEIRKVFNIRNDFPAAEE